MEKSQKRKRKETQQHGKMRRKEKKTRRNRLREGEQVEGFMIYRSESSSCQRSKAWHSK